MHSGQTDVLSKPQSMNDAAAAAARRVFLMQEHRDLDATIAMLADAANEALLTRLKKRKLHVRDEMARLETAAAV